MLDVMDMTWHSKRDGNNCVTWLHLYTKPRYINNQGGVKSETKRRKYSLSCYDSSNDMGIKQTKSINPWDEIMQWKVRIWDDMS